MNTRTDLPRQLREYYLEHQMEFPHVEYLALHGIIAKAECGEYHDFDTELATPKVHLVSDLKAIGLHSFAQMVINGEHDEEPTTEQKKELTDLVMAEMDAQDEDTG